MGLDERVRKADNGASENTEHHIYAEHRRRCKRAQHDADRERPPLFEYAGNHCDDHVCNHGGNACLHPLKHEAYDAVIAKRGIKEQPQAP